MRIAVVDKNPTQTRYNNFFDFDFDMFHLSSIKVKKLLKKE